MGGIVVKFPYNSIYIAKIKTIHGYKWYPEEKYWSVPSDNSTLEKIISLFEGEKLDIDPYLQTRNQRVALFEGLRKALIARKYSVKTIKSYIHFNEDFLMFIKKNPAEVTNDDTRDYLFYLADRKDFSASTLNVAINALKFYYGEILKKNFIYEVKRPRKDQKLPVVLSREEVSKILSPIANVKHKAILMVTYSAGLRVSEVVKLRYEDIDTERKLIHIKGAKGRKDRYTLLSDVASKTLKLYIDSYQPKKWLFHSRDVNYHITTRTAQRIFEYACKTAEIKKEVTVHSLRHSFATHLLESGVDLRYIQELLGHKSSKTTEIYTHVSNRDLSKIKNPLDSIMFGEAKNDDE